MLHRNVRIKSLEHSASAADGCEVGRKRGKRRRMRPRGNSWNGGSSSILTDQRPWGLFKWSP